MDESADEVRSYLRNQMNIVVEACEEFDKKTAKNTINSLRQKTWSPQITEILVSMAEHLLNGDFDEVTDAARKLNSVVGNGKQPIP